MAPRWSIPALLLASACAFAPALPAARSPLPVARQELDPGLSDAVFGRAARVLRQHGYELVTCDEARGVLRTERIELDAPCGASTCLARQFVTVKFGWRSVRLAVVREVFDGGLREWVPTGDPRAVAAVATEERLVMRALLAADLEGARPAEGAEDGETCRRALPCQAGQCSLMVQQIDR